VETGVFACGVKVEKENGATGDTKEKRARRGGGWKMAGLGVIV